VTGHAARPMIAAGYEKTRSKGERTGASEQRGGHYENRVRPEETGDCISAADGFAWMPHQR
jgi:hypothetical protein